MEWWLGSERCACVIRPGAIPGQNNSALVRAKVLKQFEAKTRYYTERELAWFGELQSATITRIQHVKRFEPFFDKDVEETLFTYGGQWWFSAPGKFPDSYVGKKIKFKRSAADHGPYFIEMSAWKYIRIA